jgi:surfactin synthase thioesterase subunit
MPEPEAPTYARWREVLARELSVLNGAVTLVGHSLGGSVVPFSHLEAYTARLPGATIRGLAGGDHFFENGLAELLNDIESGIQDSGFGIQGSGVMLATPPLNPKS